MRSGEVATSWLIGWLVGSLVSVLSVCAKPWIDSRPPGIIGVNWRKARGSHFEVCPPFLFIFLLSGQQIRANVNEIPRDL